MAIARDATSSGSASGATSVTVAHTCTGSNVLLLVFCYNEGNETSLSCTYNGVAMTQLNRLNFTTNGTFEYVYGILIGTGDASPHNIVFGSSNSATRTIVAASYTGVSQTGLPDSAPTPSGGTTRPLTTNFTTVADNCWCFGGGYGDGTGWATSTNTTAVVTGVNPSGKIGAGDTQGHGPITPAGSFSMTVTASTGKLSFTGISFAPAGAAPTVNPAFLLNFI